MTQETFEKITTLHKRLASLQNMCIALDSKKVVGLAYVSTTIFGVASIGECLSDILKRHDKMIREEINKEIEDINKQIAEL